jgi:hypothetical protein
MHFLGNLLRLTETSQRPRVRLGIACSSPSLFLLESGEAPSRGGKRPVAFAPAQIEQPIDLGQVAVG